MYIYIYMFILSFVHTHTCAYTCTCIYIHTLSHMQVENVDGLLGHQFVQRRMQKPSSCSACEEIIWQDGIVCQSKHMFRHTHLYICSSSALLLPKYSYFLLLLSTQTKPTCIHVYTCTCIHAYLHYMFSIDGLPR